MGIREEVYYEGGPHIGDLIFNLLIGLTVVGIPLAVGAIVRAVWLRFRITDRRVCVTGGWMGRDRYDVIYSEVMKVVVVPHGLGLWGDMAITIKNGTLIEMRAVPNFREVYDYINERVTAKNTQYSSSK
ncbi:MAG: PH domain-containing protein [Nostocales cyanobacterium ELA583]